MRALCFLFGTLLFAQAPIRPPGMECHPRTLVLFSPGPNASRQKELAPAHLNYMSQQMRANKIIAAGPFESNDGAAIVFASSDWGEVQSLLNDEPYTRAGVIKIADHKTWTACQAIGGGMLPIGR